MCELICTYGRVLFSLALSHHFLPLQEKGMQPITNLSTGSAVVVAQAVEQWHSV